MSACPFRSRRWTTRRAPSCGATRSFTIYTNDQLTQSKDWNDVIVAYRNGAPLRVRDIGQAVTGPQDTTQAAWADGKRGIVLVIFKQPGANVIDTVDKHHGGAAAAAGRPCRRRSRSSP